MKLPSIELHIEELVLEGFAPGARYGIAEAIERELATLLLERPLEIGKATHHDHLDAGHFKVAQEAGPQAIGAQIASALHQGLGR